MLLLALLALTAALPGTETRTGTYTPRLAEAPLGMPRFLPGTADEMMPSIFTWWNILDSLMADFGGQARYQTGYVREFQMRRMVELVRRPGTHLYCEIGMNGGHSTVAMLEANQNLTVHTFDTLAYNYSSVIASLLKTRYRDRITIHEGNSQVLVPAWHRANRPACDMIFVDGDHAFRGARKDLVNMRKLATPDAVLIVDDIAMPPGDALKSLATSGSIAILEEYGPYKAPHPRNPCMRAPVRAECGGNGTRPRPRRGCNPLICVPWGFAVAKYLGAGT